MGEDLDPADVAALLEDEVARQILTETRTGPMSANTLSDRCEVSPPTIYRRLEALRECGLLREATRPDPEGHHHKVYAADVDRITFEFADGGLEVRVEGHEGVADRLADQFTELVEEL